MTQVKLKKLIIHKICQFKHVSLDFGVSTSIAGNATSAVGKNRLFALYASTNKEW